MCRAHSRPQVNSSRRRDVGAAGDTRTHRLHRSRNFGAGRAGGRRTPREGTACAKAQSTLTAPRAAHERLRPQPQQLQTGHQHGLPTALQPCPLGEKTEASLCPEEQGVKNEVAGPVASSTYSGLAGVWGGGSSWAPPVWAATGGSVSVSGFGLRPHHPPLPERPESHRTTASIGVAVTIRHSGDSGPQVPRPSFHA